MKKILFFIMLFTCYPGYTQMVDMMGSLGIQSALTVGETESVARGISRLKQNQILKDITQTAMEIKTQFLGDYTFVNKNSVLGNPFNGLDWNLSSVSPNLFYIQLNHIDKNTCSVLLSSKIQTVQIELNGQNEFKNCDESNKIRFIFD